MKRISAFLILLFTAGCSGPETNPHAGVVINEFMMKSPAALSGAPDGAEHSWIELYNFGDTSVLLSNFYLSDRRTDPVKRRLPGVILHPGNHIVFWCDSSSYQSTQFLGFSFSLSKAKDEGIYLFDRNENPVDSVNYHQLFDRFNCDTASFGRIPDGSVNWQRTEKPSPSLSNRL